MLLVQVPTNFDLVGWSAISPVIPFQDLFRAERFIENTRHGGSRKNLLRVTDSGCWIPTLDEQDWSRSFNDERRAGNCLIRYRGPGAGLTSILAPYGTVQLGILVGREDTTTISHKTRQLSDTSKEQTRRAPINTHHAERVR
ncbi:uncharacterized protein LOC143373398 [Andrena cerasifolii]|uniref:uncharacterized protein LOC143373398 n=1 Tax=Andrena cerasifolii TaxID=2819439 RepID=UPI004037C840